MPQNLVSPVRVDDDADLHGATIRLTAKTAIVRANRNLPSIQFSIMPRSGIQLRLEGNELAYYPGAINESGRHMLASFVVHRGSTRNGCYPVYLEIQFSNSDNYVSSATVAHALNSIAVLTDNTPLRQNVVHYFFKIEVLDRSGATRLMNWPFSIVS